MMDSSKQRARLATLAALCLALASVGCGDSGGQPIEPLAAAALPDAGADNPFDVADPNVPLAPDEAGVTDASVPPDASGSGDTAPDAELPTHDPNGIPYCD